MRTTDVVLPSSRFGVIAWTRLRIATLKTTPPKPVIASPAMSSGSGCDFGASGISRTTGPNRIEAAAIVRPMPAAP
jgi:hypothetical protein